MSKHDPEAEWTRFWVDAQRQAAEAWGEAARRALDGGKGAGGLERLWRQAADAWVEAGRKALGGTAREVFERHLAQAGAFFGLGEELLRACQRALAGGAGEAHWREELERALDALRERMGGQGAEIFLGLPLGMWQRLGSVFAPPPGDFPGVAREGGAAGPAAGWERALRTPALGYTREWQERLQEGARHALEYQRALAEYQAQLAEVATRAVDRFRDRLLARAEAGEPVDGLRALYALWVDAAEEAYAEVVTTETYAEAYGRLVNSLMALRRHQQALAEEGAAVLGMPTRSELDTAHRRAQALRRELHALAEEVAALRREREGAQALASGAKASARRTRTGRRGKARTAGEG